MEQLGGRRRGATEQVGGVLEWSLSGTQVEFRWVAGGWRVGGGWRVAARSVAVRGVAARGVQCEAARGEALRGRGRAEAWQGRTRSGRGLTIGSGQLARSRRNSAHPPCQGVGGWV